jgi:hypothetical protein
MTNMGQPPNSLASTQMHFLALVAAISKASAASEEAQMRTFSANYSKA